MKMLITIQTLVKTIILYLLHTNDISDRDYYNIRSSCKRPDLAVLNIFMYQCRQQVLNIRAYRFKKKSPYNFRYNEQRKRFRLGAEWLWQIYTSFAAYHYGRQPRGPDEYRNTRTRWRYPSTMRIGRTDDLNRSIRSIVSA